MVNSSVSDGAGIHLDGEDVEAAPSGIRRDQKQTRGIELHVGNRVVVGLEMRQ